MLGLVFAIGVLLLAFCVLRRRRRRATKVRQDETQANGDHNTMAGREVSLATSIGIISTPRERPAGGGNGDNSSAQDGNSASTRSPGDPRPWALSSRAKASRRDQARGGFANGAPLGSQTLPPPSRETPAASLEDDADTILLRLPADLARGLMAHLAGANVRGARYAGESEDGQGSESLPAYESEPSASEVNRSRSAF